ncbi:hypothetical protein CRUP_026689 [Coryphaenoides rupestris]|nr:hypothetical protein CRUP_026689 [Coryphaenoides rupestris]
MGSRRLPCRVSRAAALMKYSGRNNLDNRNAGAGGGGVKLPALLGAVVPAQPGQLRGGGGHILPVRALVGLRPGPDRDGARAGAGHRARARRGRRLPVLASLLLLLLLLQLLLLLLLLVPAPLLLPQQLLGLQEHAGVEARGAQRLPCRVSRAAALMKYSGRNNLDNRNAGAGGGGVKLPALLGAVVPAQPGQLRGGGGHILPVRALVGLRPGPDRDGARAGAGHRARARRGRRLPVLASLLLLLLLLQLLLLLLLLVPAPLLLPQQLLGLQEHAGVEARGAQASPGGYTFSQESWEALSERQGGVPEPLRPPRTVQQHPRLSERQGGVPEPLRPPRTVQQHPRSSSGGGGGGGGGSMGRKCLACVSEQRALTQGCSGLQSVVYAIAQIPVCRDEG